MPACRSCGGEGLVPVLDLGPMPLANALVASVPPAEPEARHPLELVFCPGCALVQITETVPPQTLFGHYSYFSSFSDSFLEHARRLAERLRRDRGLDGSSLVVEVASNDGYLLQHYRQHGVPVLGIEPARNVADVARARGIPTVVEFFGHALARELRGQGVRADVLHAHNVLAHVADLNGFVAGIAEVLSDGGLAVVEVPYVKDMIDRCEFDTIYHEHLCYFSLTALARVFERARLAVSSVERLAVHGGSLRLLVSRPGAGDPSVAALLEEERAWGVAEPAFYRGFAGRVHRVQEALRGLLLDLRRAGRRVAGYGAAAKAATLLNSLALPPGTIEFVVDRSPHKQGRFLPGVHVPVRPPEALLAERPDYVLLLAWNLADEILAQQQEYRAGGGRFIVPLPDPRVVEEPA
jgi:SAM-dependent methyltransferase